MSGNGFLTGKQRHAILADYRRKNDNGEYRFTLERLGAKHGITAGEVNAIRVQEGVAGRNGRLRPTLYSCPACGFRALHSRGHGLCIGDMDLVRWEAVQAVSRGVDLGHEEVA